MRYLERHLAGTLTKLLESEPVVIVDGPRTAGKSFLVRKVVDAAGGTFLDLDNPTDLAAVEADPMTTLSAKPPVVVDEFQRASADVLGAIKAHLNRDGVSPGRFVLTGSARADLLPDVAEYLTGRHHRITLLPFSQSEIAQVEPTFLPRLFAGGSELLQPRGPEMTTDDYFELVGRGGFPLAVDRSHRARRRWYADYVTGVSSRAADVEGLRGNGEATLAAVLRGAASITAQVTSLSHIQRAVAAVRGGEAPSLDTVARYVSILERVHVVRRIDAWGTTLRSRVSKLPKIVLIDSGLASDLVGVTAQNMSLPTKMTESGHLLETFVILELLKQLSLVDVTVTIGHFRTSDGHEVDLVLEDQSGTVFGIEVKRATRIVDADLKGLRLLASKLGSRFGGGVALHTGRLATRTSTPGVAAVPISRLWDP